MAQKSPAAVVVQPAGPLLEPLQEQPGQPHQSEDEGSEGSGAEVVDCRAVDCLRERMAESSLVPSPKPLGEHRGEDEVGDCGGESKPPVEAEQVDSLQPGKLLTLDIPDEDTGGAWTSRGTGGEGFRGTGQRVGG